MIFNFFLLAFFAVEFLQAKVIMLDPAGHAKQVGRQLHNSYERAESYHFVEQLKKAIELKSQHRVLVTRAPGEAIVPLQNASFANRTNADFFLTVHMSRQDGDQPSIDVSYLTYDTLLDQTYKDYKDTDFVPIYRAHCPSLSRSKGLAIRLVEQLVAGAPKHWGVDKKVLGLPLKDLQGIKAPALVVELGLLRDREHSELVLVFAESIIACLQE
jgi:hypothetical protein